MKNWIQNALRIRTTKLTIAIAVIAIFTARLVDCFFRVSWIEVAIFTLVITLIGWLVRVCAETLPLRPLLLMLMVTFAIAEGFIYWLISGFGVYDPFMWYVSVPTGVLGAALFVGLNVLVEERYWHVNKHQLFLTKITIAQSVFFFIPQALSYWFYPQSTLTPILTFTMTLQELIHTQLWFSAVWQGTSGLWGLILGIAFQLGWANNFKFSRNH